MLSPQPKHFITHSIMTPFITKNEYAALNTEERLAYRHFLADYLAENDEQALALSVWNS